MAESRSVVLTGASRGLGRAMTGELIARGHTVHGCCRSAEAVQELRREFPAPNSFHAVDVARQPQVAGWARRVLEEAGPPDLLLNNAALINQNAPVWKVPPEEFDAVIDVNVKGIFYVLQAFLPAMVAARRGVIVNFSSGWGRHSSAEVGPYCASKHAVEGLTKSLAEELPRGMAAVPLSPGVIDTEMLRSCMGEGAAESPSPEAWVGRAIDYILKLGAAQNGMSLSIG